MKRIVIIVLAGAVIVGGSYFASKEFTKVEPRVRPPVLQMGGTSNVKVIMENRWRTGYRKHGIEAKYDSTGSTKGIERMIAKKYAIAFTHARLAEDQMKEAKANGGDVVHIPVVLCAVVPIYNVKELKGKPPLKFTGEVLADIYLGKITRWDDEAIAKLNEGVELPATKIIIVHRSDSSGTTFIFADYLHAVSKAWRDKVAKPKSEIDWPADSVGMERNDGVFEHVKITEGAIGYVDLVHVARTRMTYGALENQDKSAFIHPSAENLTAAAKSLAGHIPEDLTFSLVNQRGADAYPICGAIWAVCYQNQPAQQQKQIVDFLQWVTHDGQEFAGEDAYAPLPDELIERVDAKIKSIKAMP